MSLAPVLCIPEVSHHFTPSGSVLHIQRYLETSCGCKKVRNWSVLGLSVKQLSYNPCYQPDQISGKVKQNSIMCSNHCIRLIIIDYHTLCYLSLPLCTSEGWWEHSSCNACSIGLCVILPRRILLPGWCAHFSSTIIIVSPLFLELFSAVIFWHAAASVLPLRPSPTQPRLFPDSTEVWNLWRMLWSPTRVDQPPRS